MRGVNAMTLRIELSEQSEARLREYAKAAGKDLLAVVTEAINEKAAALEEEGGGEVRPVRNAEEWIAELRAWAASHPRIDAVVDDSRESIYAGRGE